MERLYELLAGPAENLKEKIEARRKELLLLVPEFAPSIGFCQYNHYHIYDVWEHTLTALTAVTEEDQITRLAVLFHDIGKPACFSMDEQGRGHFYRHGYVSAQMTDAILTRLECDKEVREKVVALISYHDATLSAQYKYVRRWQKRLPDEQLERFFRVKYADMMGHNPEAVSEDLICIQEMERMRRELLKEPEDRLDEQQEQDKEEADQRE